MFIGVQPGVLNVKNKDNYCKIICKMKRWYISIHVINIYTYYPLILIGKLDLAGTLQWCKKSKYLPVSACFLCFGSIYLRKLQTHSIIMRDIHHDQTLYCIPTLKLKSRLFNNYIWKTWANYLVYMIGVSIIGDFFKH